MFSSLCNLLYACSLSTRLLRARNHLLIVCNLSLTVRRELVRSTWLDERVSSGSGLPLVVVKLNMIPAKRETKHMAFPRIWWLHVCPCSRYNKCKASPVLMDPQQPGLVVLPVSANLGQFSTWTAQKQTMPSRIGRRARQQWSSLDFKQKGPCEIFASLLAIHKQLLYVAPATQSRTWIRI